MRFQARWAPWWVGAIAVAVLAPFLAAIVFGFQAPTQRQGEGVRVIAPFAGVFAYLVLALTFNIRAIDITPARFRLFFFPFPLGAGLTLPRDAIAHCYVRYVYMKSKYGTTSYYTAGVENRKGRQIDIEGSYKTEDAAAHAARVLASAFNSDPTLPPIPVHTVKSNFPDYSHRRPVLIWFGILMLALALGVVWELNTARP